MKLESYDVAEEKNRKSSVCGKEITAQDSEDPEGMCWECWDDQLTEESDSKFDELI
jgi:hypothetical protein